MNRSNGSGRLALLGAALLATAAGCGPGNGLNLARVSGKVMYDGQPVKNGTVFFMPDESKGTVGPPAVGSITSDGTFILSTETAGDGVIVGQHKVGITGVEEAPVAGDAGVELDPEKDAANFMKAKAKSAAQVSRRQPKKEEELFTDKGGKKHRYVVPMKLSRPDESGIVVKVDGSRTVNFDIDASGNVRVNP